jgi:MFS family permease
MVLPLAVALVFVLLSLLLLRFGRDGSDREAGGSLARGARPEGRGTREEPSPRVPQAPSPSSPSPLVPEATGLPYDLRLLRDCRWVSRIALFSVCACFAIVRSQFALVFRGFGYAESQFGMYLTIYALCNFAALVAAGRWALWHFKPALLFVGQAMLLLTLLMTIYGRALSTFFASSVLLGIAYGFAYCSHLYYGASASRKRSTRMVIHETVISTGLTAGSLAGGYLAEHVGLYAPYWFAIGVVGLGMIGQTAIHLGSRARVELPGSAPTANNVETAEP